MVLEQKMLRSDLLRPYFVTTGMIIGRRFVSW